MPDITVAADEAAATELVHDAEATLGNFSQSSTGSLGPFNTHCNASGYFSGGKVDLIPASQTIRVINCELHYKLSFTISINLNNILPTFCLPQVCFTIKIFKKKFTFCTPKICITWPTISLTVPVTDVARFTADFRLNVYQAGSVWHVDGVLLGMPNLQLGQTASAILVAIGLALGAVLWPIPFIGPFLAVAVAGILAAIGILGVTGWLGPVLSALVGNLTLPLYRHSRIFPAFPPDPPKYLQPVNVIIERVTAHIAGSDKDELVVGVEYS